jgi:oligogalacturonide lyase
MLAAFSGGVAAATLQTKRSRPPIAVGEFTRLIDPVTENNLLRLTSLASNNVLPRSSNRFISLRSRFLVFSSDRGGKFAPYRLDLHAGIVHQLTDAAQLDVSSLSLDPTERRLFFIDDGALIELQLINNKRSKLSEGGVTAFAHLAGPSGLLIVRDRRLQFLDSQTIGPQTIAPQPLADDVDSFCLPAPGARGCLFARNSDSPKEREFWFAPLNHTQKSSPVLLAKGEISFPFWSEDGRSLLFLRRVQQGAAALSEIHQVAVDSRCEQRVSPTSQFAAFAPNRDGSVFVGASGSKAQPDIILLLRSPVREMTICEHHSKSAASADPVFAPDSRRVFFQSDREGKTAIYSIDVQLLVEPTLS